MKTMLCLLFLATIYVAAQGHRYFRIISTSAPVGGPETVINEVGFKVDSALIPIQSAWLDSLSTTSQSTCTECNGYECRVPGCLLTYIIDGNWAVTGAPGSYHSFYASGTAFYFDLGGKFDVDTIQITTGSHWGYNDIDIEASSNGVDYTLLGSFTLSLGEAKSYAILLDLGCGLGNPGPSGCDNACGSTAVEDECGVCGGSGIASGACDCDGNVDAGCGCGRPGPSGCDNACGSTAVEDGCGVCGGSGIASGACDCDGNVDAGCGCGTLCPTGDDDADCDVMDLSSMGRLLERDYTEARYDKVGRRAREIIRQKNEMNYDEEALDAMYNIRRFWKNQEPSEFYWNKMINNYNSALETGCAYSEVGIVANIDV